MPQIVHIRVQLEMTDRKLFCVLTVDPKTEAIGSVFSAVRHGIVVGICIQDVSNVP